MKAAVSATQAHSNETFARFYTGERDQLVRALSVMLRDPDLAAEATDEAMARAYARWGTVSAYANPAGWVYRVAANWAISRLRRRRFRGTGALPENRVTDPEPSDGSLWAAVAALPPEQRAVVVLRYGLDWPLRWVAEAVDAPLGTVKSRLSRAVANLRTRVEVDS